MNDANHRTYTALCAARLGLLWTAVGLLWLTTLSWYIWGACGVAATVLYMCEFVHLQTVTNKYVCIPSAADKMWILLDPINYLTDAIGRVQTSHAPMLLRVAHWAFALFRLVGATILAGVAMVHGEFVTAWSCYKHAPIEEFVLGYCPAYTHNFHDQWVCSDPRYRFSRGCLDEPPNASWDSQPKTVHYLLLAFTFDLAVYSVMMLYVELSHDLVEAEGKRVKALRELVP